MAQEALEPKAVLFADFAKAEYLPWSELNPLGQALHPSEEHRGFLTGALLQGASPA